LRENHSDYHKTHEATIKFLSKWETIKSIKEGEEGAINPLSAEIIKDQLKALKLDGKKLSNLNEDFMKAHPSSIPAFLSYLRIKIKVIKEKINNDIEKKAITALTSDKNLGFHLEEAVNLHKLLKKNGISDSNYFVRIFL
jgi:hypothetical protein